MEDRPASSIYSTDLSRDPSAASRGQKPTYLDYSGSVRTNSRPGSFRAAKEYAESLGQIPATKPPTREPSSRVPSGPLHGASSSVSTVTSSSHAPSSSMSTISYTTQQGYEPTEDVGSSVQATPASSRPSSRPSVKPSFMNYQGGAPAQAAAAAAAPQPAVRKPVAATNGNGNGVSDHASGLLLVFLAVEVPKETLSYLEMILDLRKPSFSSLAIVGLQEQEVAIKQLKMDTYGLIGRLEKEIGVQIYLQSGWSSDEVSETVHKARKASDSITGVLYSLDYGTAETSAEPNMVSLENAALLRSWQRSVGYLHTIARATMPLMGQGSGRSENSLFLSIDKTETSPTALINKAACDTLQQQLRFADRSLTVERAKDVLSKAPEPSRTNGLTPVHIPRNNDIYDEPVFEASESPTKLWGMWALQDQLGAAD